MSIRTGGRPNITPDDLQFVFQGRKFGIELTRIDAGWHMVNLVEVFDNGADPVFMGENLVKCANEDIIAAGGPVNWIKTVFFPWLQQILKVTFDGANPGLDEFAQVDKLLSKMVRFTEQDGKPVAQLIG